MRHDLEKMGIVKKRVPMASWSLEMGTIEPKEGYLVGPGVS